MAFASRSRRILTYRNAGAICLGSGTNCGRTYNIVVITLCFSLSK